MKIYKVILSLSICLTFAAFAQRPTREQLISGSKTTENILDNPFIFSKGELQVSGEDVTSRSAYVAAIEKSDAVIIEYNEEISKFLNSNPSPFSYKNKLNSTISKASGLDNDIPMVAKEFKQGTSLGIVYYLQKLYLYKGYLEGVTRIYPDNQKLKNYLEMVSNAINSYESRDKFMSKMEENYKNYTKNLKLIPARQSNSKIELLVKIKYQEFEKKYKVTKVNITDAAWRIEKNDLGIPLNRKVSVSIAVKNDKGECGLAGANIIEEYQGGGTYGQSLMYLPTDVIVVPCINISNK